MLTEPVTTCLLPELQVPLKLVKLWSAEMSPCARAGTARRKMEAREAREAKIIVKSECMGLEAVS